MTPTELDDMAAQRIAELEQRVLDGTDDREYCLRWIGIHQQLRDAAARRR